MASHKKGQRERRQRALRRLQERIADNKYLYERLDAKLIVAEGPLRERTIEEMERLDSELDQLEDQEAGLRRNLGLRPETHFSS